MSNEYVFDKLTLIEVDAPVWCGEKSIPKDELKLTLKDYTDKSLEQLPAIKPGKLQLIDPEKLAPFKRYRMRAQTALTSYGIRYMSAVGVPNELYKKALAELKIEQQNFETYKRTFLYNYDAWVDEHANANPDIAKLILAYKKNVQAVEAALDFDYNVFKLQAPEDTDEARQKLDKKARNLGDTLYAEIAVIAKKAIVDVSRDQRQHFSSKIHGTFETMLKKMRGLAFLDGTVLPLCQAVEAALATLPKEGRITDNAFITAMGVLTTLSDPKLMRLVGEGKEQIKGQAQPGLLAMVAKKQQATANAQAQPQPRVSTPATVNKKPTAPVKTETPSKTPARGPIPNLSRKSPMAGFKL